MSWVLLLAALAHFGAHFAIVGGTGRGALATRMRRAWRAIHTMTTGNVTTGPAKSIHLKAYAKS